MLTMASAPNIPEARPISDTGVNMPSPGFSISTIPTNPTPMATHKRMETCSPSHKAAMKGINNGVE
jgi:hypothetical protein